MRISGDYCINNLQLAMINYFFCEDCSSYHHPNRLINGEYLIACECQVLEPKDQNPPNIRYHSEESVSLFHDNPQGGTINHKHAPSQTQTITKNIVKGKPPQITVNQRTPVKINSNFPQIKLSPLTKKIDHQPNRKIMKEHSSIMHPSPQQSIRKPPLIQTRQANSIPEHLHSAKFNNLQKAQPRAFTSTHQVPGKMINHSRYREQAVPLAPNRFTQLQTAHQREEFPQNLVVRQLIEQNNPRVVSINLASRDLASRIESPVYVEAEEDEECCGKNCYF